MGKYNFSAAKFAELEQRLEALKKENAVLRAKYGKKEKRRSLLRDLSNADKARAIFRIEAQGGEIVYSEDAEAHNFLTFYQNNLRWIAPLAYKNPTSGKERVVYGRLENFTDAEYKVITETLEAIVDVIAYSKEKLEKLKEESNAES